ncbi:MAG: hypothetical protein P8Z79_20880 [Sedimentisphaerales bacterium]
MGVQPFNWSVVILGYWNVAILSPGRIAEKIFGLEKGTKVPVMVSIDATIPCQVEHPNGDIRVLAGPNRLEFVLVKPNYDALRHAMECAAKVLTWLPETPVHAAGFNVNHKTVDLSSEMVKLYAKDEIDHALGELNREIDERSIARTLKYENGKVNLTFRGNADHFELLCNFHRDSKKNQELIDWLSIPIHDIETYVTELLEKFGLRLEEPSNDDTE